MERQNSEMPFRITRRAGWAQLLNKQLNGSNDGKCPGRSTKISNH